MDLFNNYTKTTFALLIISFSLAITSCDNAAGPDEGEEDHLFPVGAVLFLNGEKIAEYHDGHVHGEIKAHAGEETALITIKFIAEDGDLFQPVEPDHSLGWEVDNTSIAKINQHAEDGKWKFHVRGESTGETEVVFKLLHGVGEGAHSDFDTMPIPIHVHKHDE